MAGSGGALVVIGDAGVGKSALLAWAEHLAMAEGARVLRASGIEFEAAVSFSVLQQLLLPVMNELDALPERHRKALTVALGFADGPVQAFSQIRDAAIALIRHAAERGPVVLVVDDLQWVDRSTAAVLTGLTPVLPETIVGLVSASRAGGTLHDTIAETAIIVVEPLAAPDALALFTKAHPDVVPAVRTRLLREAQGNPLALLELPRPLTTQQRQAVEPLPGWLLLPHRLQRTFQARVGDLPAATRQLLLLAALAPTVGLALLEDAFPGTTVRDVAQPAVEAGVARLAGDRLLMRHPLVSAAVVADASPEDRSSAHRVLGEALAGSDRDLERRAWHLAEGADAPSAHVASLLEQAAAVAHRRGDGAAAMTMLLRSADLSVDTAERARRLARAAYVGASVDVPQAARIIGDLHLADPSTNLSLMAAVAAAAVLIEGEGDVDMAHRLLVGAINRYANRTDPADQTVLEAIGTLRWVCWMAGRDEMWDDYHAALRQLDPAPPPLADLASRSIDPARTTPETLRLVDEAVRSLSSGTDPDQVIQIADIAYIYDRIPACRPALERVAASAEGGGLARAGVWAHLMIGLDAFHRGRWAVTASAIRGARRLIDSGGQSVVAWACDYEIALVAAAQGDCERAAALVDAMARWSVPRRASTVSAYVSHVETLAAIGRGDFEQAFQQANVISPAGEFARHVWLALNVALDLVESAVRTRRLDAARAHVDAMTENGIARLSPRLEMICLAARALVADTVTARELFAQALAVPEGPDWRLDHARIQLLYGSHLRRNQAVSASRPALRRALATFEELKADPWAARARKELAATAGTRGAGVEGSGSRKLTAQELEITELAASGMSNKKIAEQLGISHRTVGNHLYQAYAKLGIATRGGLRDALRSYVDG